MATGGGRLGGCGMREIETKVSVIVGCFLFRGPTQGSGKVINLTIMNQHRILKVGMH